MRDELSSNLDSIMRAALAERVAPGAAIAVGRHGRIVHMKGYGRLDTAQTSPEVDENSIFDMASLTKVIATTTATMMLEEQGLLDLDRTVVSSCRSSTPPTSPPSHFGTSSRTPAGSRRSPPCTGNTGAASNTSHRSMRDPRNHCPGLQ